MLTSAAPRPRLASVLAGLGVVAALGLGACTEESDGRSLAEANLDEPELQLGHGNQAGQLGRVHLVLQPHPDQLEPEPQLQISARFVEYRGASESFVRARTNLPLPVWQQLVPGQCVASDNLLPAGETPHEDELRELSMIDGGDLRVVLGGREFVAPLSLVPDLLPWLSGVEYGHVDDRIPHLSVAPDGTSPVTITLDGSPDSELEGFRAAVSVPPALTLGTARVDAGRLTIDWRPPGDTADTLVLRLQAFASPNAEDDGAAPDPVGEELTCLVNDTGRADFALAHLAREGLGGDLQDAQLVRVSASRFDALTVDAGPFGPVEVFVELREQKTLTLR